MVEAGRLEGKPKSSSQSSTPPKPKKKSKEINTGLLASLQKSFNTLVTYSSSMLSMLSIIPDCRLN